jgi:hypothetical protein
MVDPDHISVVGGNGVSTPNVLRVDVGDEDVSWSVSNGTDANFLLQLTG